MTSMTLILTAALAAQSDTLQLPEPDLTSRVSLEAALAQRRSVREFSDASVGRKALGQLLWAAQGITDEAGYRTAPSAGALYPLELYTATADGLFHYEPNAHRLIRRSSRDMRLSIAGAALSQSAVRSAPIVIVIAGVPARTASKYGTRAPRYVHIEAGHAAQNILLQATALGLGSVPIGAFDDAALARALSLPAGADPLYLIPVGVPRR